MLDHCWLPLHGGFLVVCVCARAAQDAVFGHLGHDFHRSRSRRRRNRSRCRLRYLSLSPSWQPATVLGTGLGNRPPSPAVVALIHCDHCRSTPARPWPPAPAPGSRARPGPSSTTNRYPDLPQLNLYHYRASLAISAT